MKIDRVMFAAPKSGSGKTTITCAFLQAMKNRGRQVAAYKCGPDYIDPLFHQKVIDIPSKNLDTFFTGEEETRALLLKDRREGDLAVLEGVMGLFDGLGGVREEGSSHHLAKVTRTPVILVVDAKGMGRSVIPLVAGFLAYDTEKLIQGVLFNRMSKGYYEIIKPLLEAELQLPVVGYFPEHKEFHVESRHLGLLLPQELQNIQMQLQAAAEELERTVQVDAILEIAQAAGELGKLPDAGEGAIASKKLSDAGEKAAVAKEPVDAGEQTAAARKLPDAGEKADAEEKALSGIGEKAGAAQPPVIAVARDEAFCFYYEDNLQLLREYGAEIKFFSPLHDRKLPEGCDGLLIGGGYPELYAGQLSTNTKMLVAVKQSFEAGMPLVAECGGFLYLHSALTDKEGKTYAMAGVIPAGCYDTGRLVRFGYVELQETADKSFFLPEGERIKGHEFHYYDSEDNGESCLALKPVTGKAYPCVMTGEHYWIGFPHLYYPSNPAFAGSFVEKARRYHDRKRRGRA